MRTRAFLALGALMMVASGCAYDATSGPTSNIPGPDPQREFPADALNPLGPVAQSQDRLWDIAYPIAIGVFLLVFVGLAFIVVRFRATGDETELPVQTHGNTKLEIAWTLAPALILVVIAVPTVQTIFELADEPAEDALHVSVVGKQYWWQFEYEEEEFFAASELHIPTGREVFITLDGSGPNDGNVYGTPPVMHSFWVPSLSGKRDYVPGAIREMRIQADEPGIYPGNCAEFCGLSHANMRFTVIAHDPADYDAWVTQQQTPQQLESDDELAVAGQDLFVSTTCIGCHNITGHPALLDADGNPVDGSRVGPDLTYFAQREAFAGYIFDSPFGDSVEDPELAMEHLRQWLENPAGIKPGSQMPNLDLEDEEIDALIAYLATLE